MKIKRRPAIIIAYVVVLFAILNGPLRLSENGMASLYRLTGPFLGVYVIGTCFNKYKLECAFMTIMMIYNVFVSLAFYHHIEFQEVVIVIYVFILYAIIKYIKVKDVNFNRDFLGFLNAVCFVTVLLAWLQMFTHYSVPYIENATVRKSMTANVYLSNENELGSALACVVIINLYQLLYGKCKKKGVIVFDLLSSIFIIYRNDAKLSLMGVVVGLLFIAIYRLRKPKIRKHNSLNQGFLKDKHFFSLLVIVAVVGVIALFQINPSITTRDYKITIRELLFDNIAAIITGKEIAGVGTYHDRSTAIIYGLKEWAKTGFFGIGIGNSWTMLQMPQYVLRFAKSMHNIIAQFLVEMGYFAVVIYIIIIRHIIKLFERVRKSPIALLKASFYVAFVFISSQSSSGILSNYFTITVTIFIALLDEFKPLEKNKHICLGNEHLKNMYERGKRYHG